ncbi:hypothetical protein Tco_0668585 [Tanacetum coccineum]
MIQSPGLGNSGCNSSARSYSEVNSNRYSEEMVDTTVSSCIVSLPIFKISFIKWRDVLNWHREIPWERVTSTVVRAQLDDRHVSYLAFDGSNRMVGETVMGPPIPSLPFSLFLGSFNKFTWYKNEGGGACTLTRVAREGGVNPAWGDKFDLSKVIDKSFFYNKNSYIYLQLYTNRALLGPRFLGWCAIPARDIVDGFSQVGTARQLSYRLRKKDGSRGHGFVNVMVKLESSIFEGTKRVEPDVRRLPEMSYGRVAIGIPVKMSSEVGDHRGSLVV